ncbi:MAG: SDR family oxidoreductase, partial [Deinococcus sp.]|nr:SDR family oxidoreductase [Deinococcus sp.]
DVLVNNAGIWRGGKITDTSEEEWDRIFATNVKGIYQMSRYALPYLVAKEGRPGGSIINISSVTGLVGRPGAAAYVASKGAVTQLTKAMALDHAREGVRVNCICPGLVETEAVVEGLSAEQYQALLAERLPEHPIGRLGHPEDIAPFIVYLASDEAQWVTGAAFAVDGGYTAR